MTIKVLVVDDSVFMRKLISRLISEDAALEVVGSAQNGIEAIDKVIELKPHVVTLDVEMPQMNGLEALVRIMKECPTPILMLSSHTQEGAHETMEALQSGAVDFVAKPSGSISADLFRVKEELISKIKQAAQTPMAALLSLSRKKMTQRAAVLELKSKVSKGFNQIVAIGTSTGGPKALETVITALPANFPYPILVVQHMPPKFTKSMALRLDRLSGVKVVEAEDQQLVMSGTVYIAPGNYHMTVVEKHGEYRIHLHQEALQNGHRPSVDVLFLSIAKLLKLRQSYILMTGMGNDGAQGMVSAKQAGRCNTIAEAQITCVVYGMPKAAIDRKCVDHIVPVDQIAAKILQVTGL